MAASVLPPLLKPIISASACRDCVVSVEVVADKVGVVDMLVKFGLEFGVAVAMVSSGTV